MADYFSSGAALKLKPFRASAAAIVKELADKKVLEEDFLVDPAGFLVERLHGPVADRIPRSRLNAANRFMFAILSNDKFHSWLADYQEKTLKEFEADPTMVIDKEKIRRDLAEAMLKFGDKEIIGAILPGNFKPQPGDDPEVVFDVIGTIYGRPGIPGRDYPIPEPDYPWSKFGQNADVAVEVETVIYVVAAAAVAVVVVAVAVAGVAPDRRLSRATLTQIAQRPLLKNATVDVREMTSIAEAMVNAATQLRKSGRL